MYGGGRDRRKRMCRTAAGREADHHRRTHRVVHHTTAMSDGALTLLITAEMFSDLKQRTDEYDDYTQRTDEYVQDARQYAQPASDYAPRMDGYVPRSDSYTERTDDYVNTSRLSSPTCEDLGIPQDGCVSARGCIRNPAIHIDGMTYGVCKRDPFSPMCMIPLPSAIGISIIEPTFVRKRNERERFRVRCVNDGFSNLKNHLPLQNKEKRLSKVETLRTAIRYIKHLQTLLRDGDGGINDISEQSEFSDRGIDKRGRSDISGSDSDDYYSRECKRVKSEFLSDSSSDDDLYDAT